MNKTKFRFITILSLLLFITLALGCICTAKIQRGSAATTYDASRIFSQTSGTEIKAYRENGEDDAKAYTAFVIGSEKTVEFRRDLALKWYSGQNRVEYFNLRFTFPALNFETFTVSFESAEEDVTKEGKSTNAVVFKKNGENVDVTVKNGDKEGENASNPVTIANAAGKTITLSLQDADAAGAENCAVGEFLVFVAADDAEAVKVDKLKNVGGYFLEYRASSATVPNLPMSFTAKMPAPEEGKSAESLKVLLKELNRQSLEVKDGTAAKEGEALKVEADGTVEVTGGKIEDNTPAVLVLNEKIYPFTLGQRYSLTYEAIDVCDESVTVNRYYTIVKTTGGVSEKPEYKDSLNTSSFFLPAQENKESEEEYVCIRFDLNDGRNGTRTEEQREEDYVYLSWYAADGAVKEMNETSETEEDKFYAVKVNREQSGPKYANENADAFDAAVKEYQDAVNELAENASAGDGAEFYLPSLRKLITSDSADYRNLRFSIYFYVEGQTSSSSATSNTSLRYNGLKFAMKTKGEYCFRILAADAAGNAMTAMLDGEEVTVTSSNIWDFDKSQIPEFTFEARYTGAVIEDAGSQKAGFRDTEYSVSSFKVIALDGIEKDYTLYRVDENHLPENFTLPSYSSLVDEAKDGFTAYFENGLPKEEFKDAFDEIQAYDNDIKESDKTDWENSDNKFHWDPTKSSLTFVPAERGIYVVQLTVTDPNRTLERKFGYQVIEVNNPYDYTPGQSQWLQNNIVSVVLFSISAVLAVVIVVLFLVKPSDKKVEEVDLEKLKGRKKK